MTANWRAPVFVAIVLLASHALAAWWSATQYKTADGLQDRQSLSLDSSQDAWASATVGMDSSAYLRAAQNFAAGRGITIRETRSGAAEDTPFYYWGPGAPVVLGTWLKLVGGSTMWTFFWFAVAAQFVFGLLAIATAALWTRSAVALAIVALCTGICPPMLIAWHGPGMTCSEIVALVPLSLVFYTLARGFLAYRKWQMGSGKLRWFVWVGLWFLAGGVLIGFCSLVRDSAAVFATFAGIFLLSRAIISDRSRMAAAAAAAVLLIVGCMAVRLPIEHWNRSRIGTPVVCTSSEGCIWRYGLWLPHDSNSWFMASGIGMGEYLDPAAAKAVEQYFADHKPLPELYSLAQLAVAICHRPGDAFMFRLSRAPILWLDATHPWPNAEIGLAVGWCGAFYGLFALFCIVQIIKRREIPEVLYLFMLLLLCASPFIHAEFRYSLPVWNTLVLVPGLLVATLTRDGWRGSSNVSAENISQETTDDSMPVQSLAA